VEPRALARLAPARARRPRRRPGARPRPEPDLPGRAGAVRGRLRTDRLSLARGERRVLERARVCALLARRLALPGVGGHLLAAAALRLPGRPAARRPLARGAEHGRDRLWRLERRQRV